MSLPNYLAKIKSAGVYRFVFDDSTVSTQEVETLRLVVGYSEKGPFNTPVYVETASDFISIFGNVSKKLERRGVYFHRMSLQALQAGPILALNIKPFDAETITSIKVDANEFNNGLTTTTQKITGIYNTNRFWYLDSSKLTNDTNYIQMVSTDTKDKSCTIFVRKYVPDSYDITIHDWYANEAVEDMPEYLEGVQAEKLNNYFGEIFVFRGQFTQELVSKGSALSEYFDILTKPKQDTDPDGTPKVDGEGNPVYVQETDEEGHPVTDKDGNPVYVQVFDKITLKADYVNPYSGNTDVLLDLANDTNSNFIARYQGCMIPYFKDANGRYISLDILVNNDNYLHSIMMKMNESILDQHVFVDVDTFNKILTIQDKADNELESVYMEGYSYSTITNDKKGKDLIEAVFKMLDDKGIRTALTNNVDVNYHYIVDTFRSYIEAEAIKAKNKLFNIAKTKDNSFALVNFPFMSDFVESADYQKGNRFDITLLKNYPILSDLNGASWGAYFTSLVFSDGTLKETVPSAACVSNNFMDKYGTRLPYDIVAGPKYGKITMNNLVGPDYNYSREDLDVLEPLGVNAIIYVPRKGTYINSNQTAKQVPVSALSKIHIRELVIFIQDEIQSLLESYQWDKNTSALRDTIKAKADVILENVMNNDGVYKYLNVCDESNNTEEVIDNEMIILDTEIEPARGAGKMVNRLTIRRTGGITSSTL